jgi:hypothetical protein
MEKEISALALIMIVLVTSGCAAILDECRDVPCKDTCSGDTRLYDGVCEAGECRYLTGLCEHGCYNGACRIQPPHLVFDENPQKKGDFSLEILRAEVDTGDGEEEKDLYEFYLGVTNVGDSGSIFSIKSASIVAETGIMHSSVGFSWSDYLESGAKRYINFRISEVPPSLREQNTTAVIRTNQGHYYYGASFESETSL